MIRILPSSSRAPRTSGASRCRSNDATGGLGPGRRQGDQPLAMKLQKRFSAAHLLESAVGGSPLQQFAYLERQRTPGQRRIGLSDTFNLGDCRRIKFATTYPHALRLTPLTPSVKCVRGSVL